MELMQLAGAREPGRRTVASELEDGNANAIAHKPLKN